MHTVLPPSSFEPIDSERSILWRSRVPKGMAPRKYPLALLEQASAIALKHGIPEAVKLTGVNKWSIRKHLAYLRKKGVAGYIDGRVGKNSPIFRAKYKPEAIRAALASGMADHRATGMSLPKCIKRAAIAYGINGVYLWNRVRMGYESLDGL